MALLVVSQEFGRQVDQKEFAPALLSDACSDVGGGLIRRRSLAALSIVATLCEIMQHVSRIFECGEEGTRFRACGQASVYLYANRRVLS